MSAESSFRSYLRLWIRTAFAPAWDAFGWLGVVVGLVVWAWHRFSPESFQRFAGYFGFTPEAAMSDWIWFIPLALGIFVLVYRLLRAPYEISSAERASYQQDLSKLRAEIDVQWSQVQDLQQKVQMQLPRLRIEIDDLVVGDIELMGRGMLAVVVFISVRNSGAPSIAEDWRMNIVTADGEERVLVLSHINGTITFKTRVGDFTTADAIYNKTSQPIPSGGLARGHLFSVKTDGLTRERIFAIGTRIEIGCDDVVGAAVGATWRAADTERYLDYPASYLPASDLTYRPMTAQQPKQGRKKRHKNKR